MPPPSLIGGTPSREVPVTPDPISATPLERRDSIGVPPNYSTSLSLSHHLDPSTLLRLLPLIQWHETPFSPAPSLHLSSSASTLSF